MKTAFLFMSYDVIGANKKGVCTAVVERFDVKQIGYVVEDWIKERKQELSEKNNVSIDYIFMTNIKCIH